MRFVEVQYKKKFKLVYAGDYYSYYCKFDVKEGDIVVVDTCYGYEVAKVVNTHENMLPSSRLKAKNHIFQVVGKERPLVPAPSPEPESSDYHCEPMPLW